MKLLWLFFIASWFGSRRRMHDDLKISFLLCTVHRNLWYVRTHLLSIIESKVASSCVSLILHQLTIFEPY